MSGNDNVVRFEPKPAATLAAMCRRESGRVMKVLTEMIDDPSLPPEARRKAAELLAKCQRVTGRALAP